MLFFFTSLSHLVSAEYSGSTVEFLGVETETKREPELG